MTAAEGIASPASSQMGLMLRETPSDPARAFRFFLNINEFGTF